ncbi:hypothetical protein CVM73_18785 [Bradyrhizobium forestalis]|uniref:Uncharacterized protein n=1 Tax=Bradyrhizobium forestalis TaxID=1419263 RepID=A0A2M8R7H3_9BRAD|nr:hypothetical protein [Bradyrhizobium forestalis]PJG53774.1 hypothetical protein CVM73_18785 [Bradyrhizobium forestalis]
MLRATMCLEYTTIPKIKAQAHSPARPSYRQTLAVGLEVRTAFLVAHRLDDIEIYAQIDEAGIARIADFMPTSCVMGRSGRVVVGALVG